MPTRRRTTYHPVCYYVDSPLGRVYISNQFTAKVIYQLWCQYCCDYAIDGVVVLHAMMSPNGWSVWSRKHIIDLLNGGWKTRLLCKSIINDSIRKETLFNASVSANTDKYEWWAKHRWNDMHPNVCHSLTQSLLYPQVLQHILRAPTPLAARIALELDQLSVFPDGTSATTHIKQVWDYIHGGRSRPVRSH